MIFQAELAGRDYLRGHFLLKDLTSEQGEHRDHCWINHAREGVIIPFRMPCRIRIEGSMRRYTKDDGQQGWTITQIQRVEQI